jgi:hypothetical protein
MKVRALLLALVLPLAGCGVDLPPSCTTVGALSGVAFDLSALRVGDGPVTVEACVRQRCQPLPVGGSGFETFVQDDIRNTGPVPVRLTVTDARTGTVRSTATTLVPLHILQPNGPNCPPTAYQGNVHASADGQLVPG